MSAKALVRRVEWSGEAFDHSAWWARIPAIRDVLSDGLDLQPGVTFLVGENGSGKSTLVEGIATAYGLNPEGGSTGARHTTRASESPLGDVLRLVRSAGGRTGGYFVRAETLHGLYTYLEELPDSPDADLHVRSHGEGLLELVRRKLFRSAFYLMDEPESALSFSSTLGLLTHLHELAQAGAQVVVATHSPVLVAMPAAHIVALDADGLHDIEDWRDLDLVRHVRAYLDDPQRYLRHLISEGPGP
jgi:predicted ATPase